MATRVIIKVLPYLILDVDASHAHILQLLHGARYAEDTAKPCVDVHQQRKRAHPNATDHQHPTDHQQDSNISTTRYLVIRRASSTTSSSVATPKSGILEAHNTQQK